MLPSQLFIEGITLVVSPLLALMRDQVRVRDRIWIRSRVRVQLFIEGITLVVFISFNERLGRLLGLGLGVELGSSFLYTV
jgi:hypothetical protein